MGMQFSLIRNQCKNISLLVGINVGIFKVVIKCFQYFNFSSFLCFSACSSHKHGSSNWNWRYHTITVRCCCCLFKQIHCSISNTRSDVVKDFILLCCTKYHTLIYCRWIEKDVHRRPMHTLEKDIPIKAKICLNFILRFLCTYLLKIFIYESKGGY